VGQAACVRSDGQAQPWDAAGKLLSTNDYRQKMGPDFQAFNALPEVRLEPRLIRQAAATLQSGPQPVLPAYFSDGYFTLLPGGRRLITVQYPRASEGQSLSPRAKAYNNLLE